MVDLNDVAVFVSVVRAGSFAAAARRLGTPANTVSRRVQQLERQLGLRLMQRSTRRLTLTDAGRTFFAQCAEQVESLTQATQEMADGSQTASGKVRVAAPANFLNWFPIEVMAEFLAAHPQVQLEFELNDARADLLGEGIDVAFRAGKRIEPNLVARLIGWSSVSLVASPAYVAKRGRPESLADLSAHDCIPSPTGARPRAVWRLDGPEGEVEIEVTGRFHANSSQAQLQGALAGLGIGLLPTLLTVPHIKSGELLQVLPRYGMTGVGAYFVYLSRRHLPRAVSAFIEFTLAAMKSRDLLQPATTARSPTRTRPQRAKSARKKISRRLRAAR